MALQVIGAGFGRTGTLSMKSALETLGFVKTHHMLEVFPSKQQVRLWHDIAHGKPPQWDAVFEGFQASMDFPSSGYYQELCNHYPEAKVVLTVRDADGWYRSANDTIYAMGKAVPTWLIAVVPHARKITEMVNAAVWERVFHGRFEDEAFAKEVYLNHIEAVKTAVPPEKLLIFHPKEGWEPLCTFLGCEVPATEFPNLNDSQEFKRRISVLKVIAKLPLILGGIALLVLLARFF
ncbi:MAG: sulfotransferase family protein [Pseudomonadales bacterium]